LQSNKKNSKNEQNILTSILNESKYTTLVKKTFFQTFKKAAKTIDLKYAHLSQDELIENGWIALNGAQEFNKLGDYAMDLEISVFDKLKIKRGNINQLNNCTKLERLPKSIAVSYNYLFLVYSGDLETNHLNTRHIKMPKSLK
jgi:hypothetical protein